MKQIFLVLALIILVSCQYEKEDGPAKNLEKRIDGETCEGYYVHKGNGEFTGYDFGASGCVDLKLYSQNKKKYFDRCCYARFMLKGEMHGGCVGLFRDQYIDITETMKRMQQGDKNIWTSYAKDSKIYALDCKASYLQFFALASVLLSLLF